MDSATPFWSDVGSAGGRPASLWQTNLSFAVQTNSRKLQLQPTVFDLPFTKGFLKGLDDKTLEEIVEVVGKL